MPTEPIFAIPMITELPLSQVFTWVFMLVVVMFVVHAAVVSYHWLTFGSERSVSILSIIIYLGGGALLLTGMGMSLLLL